MPGFKVVGASLYDNLSEDMAVYIRSEGEKLVLAFGYNDSAFTRETIQLYAENFTELLRQILLGEDEVSIGELSLIDASGFEQTAKLRECEQLKKTMLLKRNRYFNTAAWDDLALVARNAKFSTYLSADVIYRERQPVEGVYVLISGNVVLSASTKGGWKSPLQISKAGEILGFSGIVDEKRVPFEAMVNSDEAMVIYVPAEDMKSIMKKYPQIGSTIINKIYTQSTQYMKMWMNS